MHIFPVYSFNALSIFFEQLSDLLNAGINLNRALLIIHDLEKNSKRKLLIRTIIEQIKSGKDFSSALATHSPTFSKSTVELIKAGETSGTLNIILQKIIDSRKTLSQIKSSLTQALSYPVILLIVALVVIGVLLLMVIPQFADMFAKFNAPLPELTKALLSLSAFLQKYFLALLATISGLALALKLLTSFSLKVKTVLDRLLLSLPFLGKVLHDFENARFASTMALLLQADIKLLTALDISLRTLGNSYFAGKIQGLILPIKSGSDLSAVSKVSGAFPDYAQQMLVVGEETGNLSMAFTKISAYHQKRIDKFTLKLKTYLEPGLIIFISGFIGIILLGMYQPIFKLNQLF